MGFYTRSAVCDLQVVRVRAPKCATAKELVSFKFSTFATTCRRPSALEILPPELTHPCEQRPPPLPSTRRCTVDVGAVGMWRCDSKVTVVRHHSSQNMVSFRYHVVANGSQNDGQKSKVTGKLTDLRVSCGLYLSPNTTLLLHPLSSNICPASDSIVY